jgi:hypothetical protein
MAGPPSQLGQPAFDQGAERGDQTAPAWGRQPFPEADRRGGAQVCWRRGGTAPVKRRVARGGMTVLPQPGRDAVRSIGSGSEGLRRRLSQGRPPMEGVSLRGQSAAVSTLTPSCRQKSAIVRFVFGCCWICLRHQSSRDWWSARCLVSAMWILPEPRHMRSGAKLPRAPRMVWLSAYPVVTGSPRR